MVKTNRKEILLILPEVPQALRDSGISIRYIPLIESIYRDCVLDILIISKDSPLVTSDSILKSYCRNIFTVTHPNANKISWINKLRTRLRFLLPWSLPRSWVAYGADIIKEKVRDITKGIHYKTIICVSGYNYPYISEISSERVVIDFIDSPSVLAWRNVIGSKRSFIIRLYETIKTFLWEARIIRNTDASLYISSSDIKVIPALLAPMKKRHVIRNGYSAADYTTATIDSIKQPSIGFLGNMSYYPNIEAILWLHQNVFLALRETYPNLALYIIGRNPVDSVRNLEKTSGVTVTGDVESIWPYLNSVDIMVFPIMRGAGVKNKIIEAMYANKLVITTAIGNEGINASNDNGIIICSTKTDFIASISRYLKAESERKQIASNGREFITNNFSWHTITSYFSRIILD